MHRLALVLFVAAASCGSSLGDPDAPARPTTSPLPEWTDADCMMFTPTACRLDVAKTSLGIDVHYPNTFFCRLQILPTADLLNPDAFSHLASSWEVTLRGSRAQTVVAPEVPQGVLEYGLGDERLYLTRVTFTAKTADTFATSIGAAFGRSDVSLFVVPVECPGRRPSP